MNVSVVKNVSIAAKLPMADNFGEKGRKAIKIPVVISITPRILENAIVLRKAKVHEKKGLFSASGRMPVASYWVNFKVPIQIKITTNPYRIRKLPELRRNIVAAVFFIIKCFEL